MIRSKLGAVALIVLMMGIFALVACGEDTVPTEAPGVSSTPSTLDLPSAPVPSALSTPLAAPSEVPKELRAVWETWALLARDFVDRSELDPEELAKAAIRGMLEALDDPHTTYITPQNYEFVQSDTSGKFEGIGATVNMTADGRLMIVAPLPETPAEEAGIKAGDVILEVDGESIEGLSLLEAVLRIRGPRGSTVRLLVTHLFEDESQIIEVVRGVIKLSSVNMNITAENFAYIHLRVFYENTNEELVDLLEEAKVQRVRGIILDLRNNPGGILSATVDVASQFLEDGLVLYEIDGTGRRSDWPVRRGGVATDIPMVVLGNEFSGSASEVLIGALQDHKRAIMVGAQTFGKGSVNILRPLSDGGGLYITLARWYTPDGRLIEGKGLDPDIEVRALGGQREDSQFNKAVEILESQISASVR